MLRTDDPAGAAREPLLPTSRRGWRVVIGILLVAFALRAGVVLVTHGTYNALTDAADYSRIANSVADGNGFPDANLLDTEGPSALRAPLYPLTLAAVYAVAGPNRFTLGRLVNAAIGTVMVALIGIIAAQLWSRRVAYVAMALAAVYPTLILYGSALLLEPLLVTLSLGAVAAALQHRRSPQGLRWPILAGVLLGLTVLTRELGLLLIPAVVLLLWTKQPRWSRAAVAAPIAFLLVGFVVVLPWTIRNTIEFNEFVPTTTGSGYGLAGTFNETAMSDGSHPGQWIEPNRDPEMADVILDHPRSTEPELDSALRDAVIDEIREHPTYPLKAAVFGTQRLFDWDGGDYAYDVNATYLGYPLWLTYLAVWSGWGMFALALIGAFLPAARRAPFALWLTPILLFVFIIFTLPASIRYRASIEPYFVLLASGTVIAFGRRLRRREPGRADAMTESTLTT